jgi:integrase
MTPKRIDIHNYKKQEASAKEKVEASLISDSNKKLIFDFVDYLTLTVNISTPRRVKLLYALKTISLTLGQDFSEATQKDLEKLVAKIRSDEEYSAWTVSDFIKILKRFYKWLIQKQNLQLNVDWMNGTLKEKDMPKLKRSDMITEAEIKRLIESCDSARDKAILALVWDTGARIGEIGGMTIGSVHFEDQGTVVDLSGKTGKRSVFIIESTPYLNTWISLHPYKNEPNAPLWVNLGQDKDYKYQPIGYRTYYKMFERAFEKAGVKKSFNPHLFRHSRALWCVQNNWNQIMANKMFGWGLSSKMYGYYVSLSTEDLKDKMMESYGLQSKTKDSVEERKPRNCPRCEALNKKESKFCYRCGMVLDLKTIVTREDLEKEILSQPLTAKNVSNVKEAIFQSIKDTLLKDSTFIEQLKSVKK